jgi:hypothetical protein
MIKGSLPQPFKIIFEILLDGKAFLKRSASELQLSVDLGEAG